MKQQGIQIFASVLPYIAIMLWLLWSLCVSADDCPKAHPTGSYFNRMNENAIKQYEVLIKQFENKRNKDIKK